jgi:hypothetical protein
LTFQFDPCHSRLFTELLLLVTSSVTCQMTRGEGMEEGDGRGLPSNAKPNDWRHTCWLPPPGGFFVCQPSRCSDASRRGEVIGRGEIKKVTAQRRQQPEMMRLPRVLAQSSIVPHRNRLSTLMAPLMAAPPASLGSPKFENN